MKEGEKHRQRKGSYSTTHTQHRHRKQCQCHAGQCEEGRQSRCKTRYEELYILFKLGS